MASIRARKNKEGVITSYQFRVFKGKDAQGKQLKPYVKTWNIPKGMSKAKAEKEAEKLAIIFEKECKEGMVGNENLKFYEYADYFMKMKERDAKNRTIGRYRDLLVRINEEIGFLKLKDINAEHLNKFYIKLGQKGASKKSGEGLTPKTILEHHRLIHTILSQAVKESVIPFNVADKSTPPKLEKKEAKVFEVDELVEIMDCLQTQPLKWQCITHLLLCTGARRGEVMGLKWCNVDFNHKIIKIESALLYDSKFGTYEDTPKNHKTRYVAISDEVCDLLHDLMNEQMNLFHQASLLWTTETYCFLQKGLDKPMNPDSATDWLKKFYKKYNLPHINPHKFRHTQASILYATGNDPVAISNRLGHSNVSTTQNIYAHLLSKNEAMASNSIAEVIYKEYENKKENDESKPFN